jgi:hypothetical protein
MPSTRHNSPIFFKINKAVMLMSRSDKVTSIWSCDICHRAAGETTDGKRHPALVSVYEFLGLPADAGPPCDICQQCSKRPISDLKNVRFLTSAALSEHRMPPASHNPSRKPPDGFPRIG